MKKFFLFLIFVILISNISSAELEDYDLIYNMTFENNIIGDFTTSGNIWSLSASNCFSGSKCLAYSSTGEEGISYIQNSTFYLNTTQNPILKGWIRISYIGSKEYAGYIINYHAGNYSSAGFGSDFTNTVLQTITSGDANTTVYTGCNSNYCWFTMNISKQESNNTCLDITLYNDSTENNMILKNNCIFGETLQYEGFYGLTAYRDSYFDNIEFYTKTPVLIPEINGNFSLISKTNSSLTLLYTCFSNINCSYVESYINNTLVLNFSLIGNNVSSQQTILNLISNTTYFINTSFYYNNSLFYIIGHNFTTLENGVLTQVQLLEQILNEIENTNTINSKIGEGINMLWLIIPMLVFLGCAFLTKQYYFLFASGLISWLITLGLLENFDVNNYFLIAEIIFFLVLGIAMFVFAIIQQFSVEEKEDFYKKVKY